MSLLGSTNVTLNTIYIQQQRRPWSWWGSTLMHTLAVHAYRCDEPSRARVRDRQLTYRQGNVKALVPARTKLGSALNRNIFILNSVYEN